MTLFRFLITGLVIALIMLACTAADAGSISRGAPSFSRAAAPAPARSIGVQRAAPPPTPKPAPTAAATKPAQAAPPTVRTNTIVTTPAPVVVHSGGTGGSGGFLSSFAGGAAGAIVGNAISQPHGTTVVQGAPAAAPAVAANGEPIASPVMVAAQPQRSATAAAFDASLSIVVFCLVILAAAVACWLLYRAYRRNQEKATKMEADKQCEIARELMPISLFVRVQKAFAAADKDALRNLCTPDFFAFVETDVPDGPKPYTLTDVTGLPNVNGLEATVRYTARDTADGTKLNETWNLDYLDGRWLVAGIRQ